MSMFADSPIIIPSTEPMNGNMWYMKLQQSFNVESEPVTEVQALLT